MIAPDRAFEIISKHVRPLKRVRVSVHDALGYRLAEDVRADRDLPPADRSAMDGYAVRAQDIGARTSTLKLAGEVAAGSPARPRVRPGTCVRILTGANVPPGADTVVMVEQTKESDGLVSFHTHAKPGANIFRRGEDAHRRDILLQRGTLLHAPQIGVCAAVGRAELWVHRRPLVRVLCTGEELCAVEDRVRAHQMRNSKGPVLDAALRTWGFAAKKYSVVPDDLKTLVARLKRALAGSDVVVLTGGVSVGKYDFVREAVEKIGGTVRFHGVHMKPGKPCLFATCSGNRHIFGMPGNPLSAMTGFNEYALPALCLLSGTPEGACRPTVYATLTDPVEAKGDRVRYMLGKLLWKEEGVFVEPVHSQSSADLVAGGQADGALIIPSRTRRLTAGATVKFRPWRPLP